MFTDDCRFEGFTAADWLRVIDLFRPRASADREPNRPRGAVFVVHDGSRVLKMLHTKRGRITSQSAWPVPLATLAKEHHSSWVLAAHFGALDEVMERFGARIRRSDDLTSQTVTLMQIISEMLAEGALESYPRRLRGVPLPRDTTISRAIDAVCPPGMSLVLGLFERDELHTSLVLRRRGSAFDAIVGPEAMRGSMGLVAGDWRRDYRHLARAVEERLGPIGLGCYAERQVFRDLITDAKPGDWAQAIVLRHCLIRPVPSGIGMALAVDGARGGIEKLKVLPAVRAIEPVLHLARERARALSGARDVPGVLGFDPMATLRALLKR